MIGSTTEGPDMSTDDFEQNTVAKHEADQLHNATLVIEEGKAQASNGFLMIGSALSLVAKEKLWVDHYKDFGEYCTSVNISRSHAYKLVGIWDRFGDKAKGIQVHRLSKLLPFRVTEQVDEDTLLAQARDLNPGAFQALLQELKGKTPSDGDCKHDGEIHSYCAKCRKRMG